MIIGIDASRAFIKKRTGIEEYSYQTIKHLKDKLDAHQVILYVRSGQKSVMDALDFSLPENWRVKALCAPRFWTQFRLSLELFLHPVDTLFVPAHTVPLIHPRKTIVTVHGLEYEVFPHGYSAWERFYMRFSIKNSCRWANTIVTVSRNTKQDLIDLYKISEKKMQVIYEGYDSNFQFPISNFQTNSNDQISKPYLLYVGRIEERKNINGIIDTYKILKERYNIPHSLVLAGRAGHNYKIIKLKIENSKFKIIEPGYVSETMKWQLLSNADVFLFPTFYEGFGIPVLEAQSAGVPVVASNNSSMPEVAGNSAVLVDPEDTENIAEKTHALLYDQVLRDDIIKRGYENVKRFSWEECASQIANLMEDGHKK